GPNCHTERRTGACACDANPASADGDTPPSSPPPHPQLWRHATETAVSLDKLLQGWWWGGGPAEEAAAAHDFQDVSEAYLPPHWIERLIRPHGSPPLAGECRKV